MERRSFPRRSRGRSRHPLGVRGNRDGNDQNSVTAVKLKARSRSTGEREGAPTRGHAREVGHIENRRTHVLHREVMERGHPEIMRLLRSLPKPEKLRDANEAKTRMWA